MSSSIDNPYAITDTTTVKSILENIANEKNWSKEDVTNDLSILARNRIHHVHDLRALSSESWAQIELLPLVKDLLRNAIDSDWPKNNTCNSSKQVEDQLSEYEKKKDKKKKDEEDEAKKKKKDKKKKGGSLLGSPVEPAILTHHSVSNGYLHDNSSDTSLISQDPITIENTIRNANVGNTSEEEDNESDESEEYNTPTTPARRKSVSFSNETSIINDITKKEKKKDKKNKKKKKEKGLVNPSLAYPYTHRPIVNIHHQPSRNYQTLPPVPPDDSFLQSIHDKLVSSSTTVDV